MNNIRLFNCSEDDVETEAAEAEVGGEGDKTEDVESANESDGIDAVAKNKKLEKEEGRD